MNDTIADQGPAETPAPAPETPAPAPEAPTPAAPRIEAESLSVLDRELEELIAEQVTVNVAVDILLNAIENERGVERKDVAEINIHADGVVRLLTRGRVRRSLRVNPFVPTDALKDSE